MSEVEAGTLFREGRLEEAVAAAVRAVKGAPTDVSARMLLAELLLFTGDLARADVVLDAADAVDPGIVLVAAEFRQLLRAEVARRQSLGEGRLPEFLGGPTPDQEATLATLVAVRVGDLDAAAAAAAAAEAAREPTPAMVDGRAVDDLRDVDDLLAGNLEVLTTTGKYYWIPIARVVTMEFHPPKRPRDLFWRRCTMVVRDGPQGDVYLPALYEARTDDDVLRLGRRTEWTEEPPVRGVGQRMFLAGDDGVAISGMRTVERA